jgi:hypothetical protein
MTQTTALTFSEWEAKYKPKANHLVEGASFQDEDGVGIMFETYGVEVDYVRTNSNNHIWTYIDEDDKGYIIAGYHWINRIGYFITAEPWTDEWESIPLDEEAN